MVSIRAQIVDVPSMPNESFEDRMQWLQENFGPGEYTPVRLFMPRERIYQPHSRLSHLDHIFLPFHRLSPVLISDYRSLIDRIAGR